MELIEQCDPVDPSDSIWASLRNEASKSTMRFQLGALLLDKKGRVISFGHNTSKTHPRFGSKDGFKTMHAEGNVLFNCEKLGYDPRGGTMIVYRKGGRNSKPCPSCQKMLEKAGIKKVIYTNYEKRNHC